MSLLRRGGARGLIALYLEAGRNLERCGALVGDLLREYPEHAALADEVGTCAQEGDRLTREILREFAGGRRPRIALAAAEGRALAGAIDDAIDGCEQAAARLRLYGVEAPMEQAVELAGLLPLAAAALVEAVGRVMEGAGADAQLAELQRLGRKGDLVEHDGVASLFAGGIDPMVVIRWKDIFESLAAALDACLAAARVLEVAGPRRRTRAD